MHNEIFYTNKDINDFKLALISDIHYYPEYNKNIFDNLVNQIERNKADYIVIAGDTLDSSDVKDLKLLESFLKRLAALAPTFIVKGNHDEKKGVMHNWTCNINNDFIKLINSIDNLHYLDDNIFTINNITFYGFNLSYNYYEIENETYESFCKEIEKINCHLSDTTYNVVLFHSPINIYTFIKNNPNHGLSKSDLILSGHMHNGCLPFIISYPINKIFKSTRGILSPTKKFFPKYAHGRIYERDGYVYEGVTKVSHSAKMFHSLDVFFQKRVEFLTIKKN